MAKLLNPLSATIVAIIIGTAVGLFWYRTKAQAILAALPVRTVAGPTGPKAMAEAKAKGWDFWTVEVDNLSSELKGEKERLKTESDQLDIKAQRLAAESQELDKIRANLDAMRREINDRVVEVGADESKNLRTLAAMYSNLTPAGAVTIFQEMDDSTAIKIMSLMKPDIVGPILEAMAHGGQTQAHRAAVLSDRFRLLKS